MFWLICRIIVILVVDGLIVFMLVVSVVVWVVILCCVRLVLDLVYCFLNLFVCLGIIIVVVWLIVVVGVFGENDVIVLVIFVVRCIIFWEF